MRVALLILALTLLGCDGPGRIQYDGGKCLADGRSITLPEVEELQANVARRIASHQPWFAVITIVVVLLAAAGNAEKILAIVRERHTQPGRSLSEVLRGILQRQRESPVRYFSLLGGSFALLAFAATFYIYLDIDKRTSERALGMLQFCHLALRNAEEHGELDEQKRNLQSIEATAGDIRALINKLPPAEQRKAQAIVEQMNNALAREGKVVSDYATRVDASSKSLREDTEVVQRGLTSLEGELAPLRALPAGVTEIADVSRRLDAQLAANGAAVTELKAQVAQLDAHVAQLLAKPACAEEPSRESSKAGELAKPVAHAAPITDAEAGRP